MTAVELEAPVRRPVPDWEGAVCATTDPYIFFPKRGSNVGRQAKKLCQTCPLLEVCREYGKTEEFGIWGGTSALDRGMARG